MTTIKLRSVDEVANLIDDGSDRLHKIAVREVSTDREHIAKAIIEWLEERKEIIRATYDTQMEERVHRIAEINGFIEVIKSIYQTEDK